jgi:hypothetical protein
VGESRTAYRVLIENLKRSLGRPRGRWEDNIKVHLNTLGTGHLNCLKPPFPGSKPSGAREEDKELFVLYIYHGSLIQSEVTFL